MPEPSANPFAAARALPPPAAVQRMWDKEVNAPTMWGIDRDSWEDNVKLPDRLQSLLEYAQRLEDILHGVSDGYRRYVTERPWSTILHNVFRTPGVYVFPDRFPVIMGTIGATVASKNGSGAPMEGDWAARVTNAQINGTLTVLFDSDGTRTLSKEAERVNTLVGVIRTHTLPAFHVSLMGRFVKWLSDAKVDTDHLNDTLRGVRELPVGLAETMFSDEWLAPLFTAHTWLTNKGYGGAFAPEG